MDNIPKKELHKLLEMVNNFAKCSNASEFEERTREIGALVPYEMSLCTNGNIRARTVGKMINHNFPCHYLKLYFEKDMMLQDPCINKSIMLGKSHFYNIDNHNDDNSSDKLYASLNRDFDLTQSLSSIFTDTSGKTTYLCLTNPTEKPHPRHLRVVDILMPHLHHTMNRVYSTNDSSGLPTLSKREIEILKWAMEGKTNWELSKILSISEATVKFHFGNIFRKLEVVNKGHAIAKTLQLGILAL